MATIKQIRGKLHTHAPVNIELAFGGFLTQVIDLGGTTLTAIQTPATIAGNQFRFRAGYDEHHMVDLYDEAGDPVQAEYAANRFVELPNDAFDGVQFLQILTTTNGVPVNQAADVTLYIVCKGNM